MKKLCMVLFAGLLLVGCAGKEKKVICTETDQGDEYVYEFNAKGDTMYSHNIDMKLDLVELGVEEADLTDENIKGTLAQLDALLISDYKNLTGVTLTSKIDDTKKYYNATINMDFDKADFDQLVSAGFLDKGTMEVSLEKTLEDYTGCVEQ